MKKLLTLFVAMVFSLAFVACGGSTNTEAQEATETVEEGVEDLEDEMEEAGEEVEEAVEDTADDMEEGAEEAAEEVEEETTEE